MQRRYIIENKLNNLNMKKMSKTKRTEYVTFRVTEADKSLLQELSANTQISLSALARFKVQELLEEAKQAKR